VTLNRAYLLSLAFLLLFLLGCRLNDIIVSVNGISTENVTHAQAVETLKRAGHSVLLVGVLYAMISWYFSVIYKWLNLHSRYSFKYSRHTS